MSQDEKLKQMMNLMGGLDALHGHKLSRIAMLFANLEMELEEILGAETPSMIAVSRMLEVASMVAGAGVAGSGSAS